MSDAVKPKGKGMMRMLMLGGLAAVLLGGGVAGGLYAAKTGLLGGAAKASGAKAAHGGGHGGGGDHGGGEGGGQYVTLEQGFTSNLRDSDSYVQLSLAVSTTDSAGAEAVEANEPALRSAVLELLAEQSYETVSSSAGRAGLRKAIKRSLDDVMRHKVGSGGIDNVYFTAFVVQ